MGRSTGGGYSVLFLLTGGHGKHKGGISGRMEEYLGLMKNKKNIRGSTNCMRSAANEDFFGNEHGIAKDATTCGRSVGKMEELRKQGQQHGTHSRVYHPC